MPSLSYCGVSLEVPSNGVDIHFNADGSLSLKYTNFTGTMLLQKVEIEQREPVSHGFPVATPEPTPVFEASPVTTLQPTPLRKGKKQNGISQKGTSVTPILSISKERKGKSTKKPGKKSLNDADATLNDELLAVIVAEKKNLLVQLNEAASVPNAEDLEKAEGHEMEDEGLGCVNKDDSKMDVEEPTESVPVATIEARPVVPEPLHALVEPKQSVNPKNGFQMKVLKMFKAVPSRKAESKIAEQINVDCANESPKAKHSPPKQTNQEIIDLEHDDTNNPHLTSKSQNTQDGSSKRVQFGGDDSVKASETTDKEPCGSLVQWDWERVPRKEQSTAWPSGRWGASLTSIGSQMYLFGGQSNDDNLLNDMYVFDTSKKEWSAVTNAPFEALQHGRVWHSAVSQESRIIVFGGETKAAADRKENVQVGDIAVYETEFNSWFSATASGTAPCRRSGHSACLLESGKMLIFGGSSGRKFLSDVFALDTSSWSWTRVPVQSDSSKCPGPRAYATLTSFGNKVVLFGGNDFDNAFNDVYVFNIQSGTWTKPIVTGTPPQARSGHIAVRSGSKLLIFGGWNFPSFHFHDAFSLDTELWHWESVSRESKLPSARVGSASATNPDSLETVVFGGMLPDHTNLDKVEDTFIV
mmetsp:Transcript_2280/g.4001  ORF Transcript_2280/g.4001 Transcript_2280/m.4001 type:complete len:640 (-) Transcript_2280:194-2113(-)